MRYTFREALALEAALGGSYIGDVLRWIEITCYFDPEAMYILATPTCDYCGKVRPGHQCTSCGAGVPHSANA